MCQYKKSYVFYSKYYDNKSTKKNAIADNRDHTTATFRHAKTSRIPRENSPTTRYATSHYRTVPRETFTYTL